MPEPTEGARPAHHADLSPRDHKGWYTPRKLPHFDSAATFQAITFRLADSLPREVALARKGEGNAAYRRRISEALDAGFGACLLRDPEPAAIVESALLQGVDDRYELVSWVVMPNHVHALSHQPKGSASRTLCRAGVLDGKDNQPQAWHCRSCLAA